MKVVSVVNQKGGVAKTTTTANLGACLAAKGLRTLLVDLDPQANLTLGMRRDWPALPYGLADVLIHSERYPLAGIVRRVGDMPLYIAPGHADLAKAEASIVRQEKPPTELRKALHALSSREAFDWVLLDCPPSLGVLTQNALIASNFLLIPTEPKMYAFAGMDTLNRLVQNIAKEHHLPLRLLGVLLTMVERGTRLHRTISNVIRERFGPYVFETEIYKNVRISEAELEGRSVIEHDPRATGAHAYRALTEEVLHRTS